MSIIPTRIIWIIIMTSICNITTHLCLYPYFVLLRIKYKGDNTISPKGALRSISIKSVATATMAIIMNNTIAPISSNLSLSISPCSMLYDYKFPFASLQEEQRT